MRLRRLPRQAATPRSSESYPKPAREPVSESEAGAKRLVHAVHDLIAEVAPDPDVFADPRVTIDAPEMAALHNRVLASRPEVGRGHDHLHRVALVLIDVRERSDDRQRADSIAAVVLNHDARPSALLFVPDRPGQIDVDNISAGEGNSWHRRTTYPTGWASEVRRKAICSSVNSTARVSLIAIVIPARQGFQQSCSDFGLARLSAILRFCQQARGIFLRDEV